MNNIHKPINLKGKRGKSTKNNNKLHTKNTKQIYGTCLSKDGYVISQRIIQGLIVEGTFFNITINTNSTLSNFNFSEKYKRISFNVESETGTIGFCNVTIPTNLLGGPYTIKIDNVTILKECDPPTNRTHTFLYFTYNHSTHTVEIIGTTIIPEFPSTTIMLLFMSLFTTALVAKKKRLSIFPRRIKTKRK